MQSPKDSLPSAILSCLVACFFLATAGTFIKLASSSVSVPAILFAQNTLGFLFILPQVYRRGFMSLKTQKWKLHLARDILGLAGYFLLFLSFQLIPLVVASLFQNTAPLWVPLFSWLFLKRKIPLSVWIGITTGFFGVAFVMQPGSQVVSFGASLALLSGVISGATLIIMRKLALTEPTHRTLFYYFLVNAIVSAPFAWADQPLLTQGIFGYLLLIGTSIFFGQMMLTYSFKHGEATVVAPITYSVILFSGFYDWFFWLKVPNALTFFGITLVVGGALIALYHQRQA
jgi:drug/metabolite transporter (DMT)-like permease